MPDPRVSMRYMPHARWGTRVAAVALALLLSACASVLLPGENSSGSGNGNGNGNTDTMSSAQMRTASDELRQMVALQDRLYMVAAPLLIINADLCKTQARSLLGFTAKNKFSFPGDYAEAAQAVLGYDDRLQVSNVLAGSGAARAGLREGDGLISAEGQPLPTGPGAETGAAGVLGPLLRKRSTLKMTIARGQEEMVLNVPITRTCAFRIELGNADNINSYADGQRVMLTRGMINFTRNNTEIAYVMAKDMAHNILEHPSKQNSSATLAGIIDNLASVHPDLSMLIGSAGIKVMPQQRDADADSLALYLLARAGYDINQVAPFWQRLASAYPASMMNSYTANHPDIAYRVTAIDATVAEIKSKQASREPLQP
ncbi:MAG: hypothetical protein ACI83P_000035 [Janthinobacterium sp.]|jgi:hypothetical protein